MRCLHPVFPIVKLTPYEPDPIPNRASSPPPPPVIMDGGKEYVIEKILEARYRWKRLWYKVRWQGYDASEDEWIRSDDLHNADDVLEAFYKAHPGAPRQVVQSLFSSIPFRSVPPTQPCHNLRVHRDAAL